MVRRFIQLLCPVCFIAWWIISATTIMLTATPALAPRLAEFLRANGGTVIFLCLVLLPISVYLRPPNVYGSMLPEHRRELNRTPLTRLTRRSAISLFVEIIVLLLLVALCVPIVFLALLDAIWRNPPGHPVMFCIGLAAFYVCSLALWRLRHFIYPL